MKRLLLIDFLALFHRSRSALLRSLGELSLPDGTPTTGTFAFSNNFLAVLDEVKPTHCVVVYDAGGNFRKEQSTEYKANRRKNTDSFYVEADNVKREILPAFGVKTVGIKGVEADDVIFTLAHTMAPQFDEIVILTCDQDILQCVTDKVKVLLFSSAKRKTMMGIEETKEKLGVEPKHIPMLKALAGDSSDNISGIKGVGAKTALKILTECDFDWSRVLQHKRVADYSNFAEANLELTKSVYVSSVLTMNPEETRLGNGTFQLVDYVLEKYHFKTMQKRRAKILKSLGINDGTKNS